MIVISLSYSCKKEPENCIITGQLVNCDGTPYANKVATMVKNGYNSSGTIVGSNVYTDGQGYFEFEYPKEENEYGFYNLFIESTNILTDLTLGKNYRLNTIHINPSIHAVLKVKILNPYNSDYQLVCDINYGANFQMNGPFNDTLIGQYNIDIIPPFNANALYENNGKPYFPIVTYLVKTNPGMADSSFYIPQHLPVTICSQSPDTIFLIIK